MFLLIFKKLQTRFKFLSKFRKVFQFFLQDAISVSLFDKMRKVFHTFRQKAKIF